MNGLRLIPEKTSIPFIGLRKLFYAISLIVMALTIASYFIKGLNFGIDFKGGIMIEAKSDKAVDVGALRTKINSLGLGDTSLQEFGSPQDILIRLEHQEGGSKGQQNAIAALKFTLGDGVEFRRIETVGPKVGQELIQNGLLAVLYGLLAMLVYIWFRFEWQFGLCAIAALVHNAIAVLGLYTIFGIEFNTTAIVAVLTTIGYSINDTVVIFDRIRENLRKYKKKPVDEVMNQSINDTLSRTILTSGSTLTALFALYFFGGEVIASYSLPIIVGVIVGTYASICIASPMLLFFNLRTFIDEEEESEKGLSQEASA